MIAGKHIERIFLTIFLLLPVLYCIFFAPVGFADTDQGFMDALSWRILNGQTPHLDFEYARPAFPLYFHALEMWLLPDGSEVLGGRCLMYIQLWLSVLFAVLAVNNVSREIIPKWNLWLLASLAFAMTVHNYPPMPWHTITGIFFASAGLFLFTLSKSIPAIALGTSCLLLAAFSKQPFVLIPFAGLFLVWSLYGKKILIQAVIVLDVVIIAAGILLATMAPGFLSAMFEDIIGSSGISELLQAGLFEYGKGIAVVLVAIGITSLVSMLFGGNYRTQWLIPDAFWLILIAFAAVNLFRSYQEEAFMAPGFGFPQGIWILGLLASWRLWREEKKQGMIMFTLHLVAWAASISWGYQTPILFIAPAVIGVANYVSILAHPRNPFSLHTGVFLIMTMMSFAMYQYPYHDSVRISCNYDLGELSPRYENIRTGNDSFRKHSDLRMISETYGRDLTVFPSMPHANYFLGKNPAWTSDWVHNAEIGFEKHADELKNSLNDSGVLVLLEKDKLKELDKDGKYGAGIAKFVSESWTLIEDSEYFLIYDRIEE